MIVKSRPLKKKGFAVWIITPNGRNLADRIAQNMKDVHLFCSEKIGGTGQKHIKFHSLADTIKTVFHNYKGHIFITSTGIAVRVIAPFIRHKMKDPAVVVVDDQGKNAVSLLSGHLGGANDLTRKIAKIIGAHPVITTATDVNRITAIDVLAKEKQLFIENSRAIKTISMALLTGKTVYVHDPFDLLGNCLPNSESWNYTDCPGGMTAGGRAKRTQKIPGVYVDDRKCDLPPDVLILRPASLVAGIGCNRNTDAQEMNALLEDVFDKFKLALASLNCIASIDLKADESGLIGFAQNLGRPLVFFNRQELNQVKDIKNPSVVVQKHIGVRSVCEAAAILAARGGKLIVPKQSTKNVTLAVARIGSSS